MGKPLSEELMSKKVYEAAVKGKVEILKETDKSEKDLLLRKTFVSNNIVHVALRMRSSKSYNFARKAASRYPQLAAWESNLDGDTPLHAAAELDGTEEFVREVCGRLPDDERSLSRMQNSMGNTPLHVALIHKRHGIAEIMVEKDPYLATVVNNSNEAPLHLAIKYFPDFDEHNDQLLDDPVKHKSFMEQKKLDIINMMQEQEQSWYYPAEEGYEEERHDGNEEHKEVKIIMVLLEKASYVAGWQDAIGLTPLHLAASLDKAFNLVVISYMINCCPQSMEVCDSSGKTILHYLIHRILYLSEAKKYLYDPWLHSLKDHQDHDGNTPLHLALINNDFIMFLLIPDRNCRLKNKAGQSIKTLIKHGEFAKFIREGSVKGFMMIEEMSHSAECGDVVTLERLLQKIGGHYRSAQDSIGKNLIHKLFQIKKEHVVIPHKYNGFIGDMVGEYPGLLTNTDDNGDTPLHLLSTVYPTPPISDDVLRNIVNNHIDDGRNLLDKEGLTPFMRAIKASNIAFAERLCSLCPKIVELSGSDGQTFWHLLAIPPLITLFDFEHSSFFTNNEVLRKQLKKKNKKEDTALHTAIGCKNFDAAKLFLSFRTYDGTQRIHEQLLRIPGKDGKTPEELIGESPHLPPHFEDVIWEDSTMVGTRSMWRIPTTQMESYVNTMGVIAALLTTITFTAAFTVPGGLIQEKGTPLLISDPAFQVFMISNVLAMCLSMMVLFCLLWIMATGNKSKSVVLLDVSICFLLAAFYLTLFTFMTGLYATTHLGKRWIAILSLALCSFSLLVMLMYLVVYILIPYRKAVRIYQIYTFWYLINGLLKSSISLIQICCPWSSSPRPNTQRPSVPSNNNDIESPTSVPIEDS